MTLTNCARLMLLTVVGSLSVTVPPVCLCVCLKWVHGVILQFSVNTMRSNGTHICYAIHCDLELEVVAESERTKRVHLALLTGRRQWRDLFHYFTACSTHVLPRHT